MADYHEYTGKAVVSATQNVEFTVAIPDGSSSDEMEELMRAAARAQAERAKHSVQEEINIHNFSRGAKLSSERPKLSSERPNTSTTSPSSETVSVTPS